MSEFTDEDFRATILRALKLVCVLTVVALPLVWWKLGWQSAVLVVVGAAISGSGLWEWRRLMSAMMVRMAAEDVDSTRQPAKKPSMALILVGFFVRLGLTVALLYVSLKFLDGSVYALAGGLLMGVIALTVEGVRLLRKWTV